MLVYRSNLITNNNMKYSLLSECCGAEPREDHRYRNGNHHDLVDIYVCTKCEKECDVVSSPDHDCHLSPEDGCTHESHSRRIPVQDMNEPTTVMGAFAKVQESVDELQDILNRDPLKALKYNNFPF